MAPAQVMVAVSLDTIQFGPTFDTFKAAFNQEEDSLRRVAILILTAVLCYQVDFAVGITTGVVVDRVSSGKGFKGGA